MKKRIFILSLLVLLNLPSFAEEADGVSEFCEVWSSPVSLDTLTVPNTSSTPIELHFWDELPYSTKWADLGRCGSVQVNANAYGIPEQYVFSTSISGMEGTFTWNYAVSDAETLPRGASCVYALTHTSYYNDEPEETETVYVTLSENTAAEADWSEPFALDNVSVNASELVLPDPAQIVYSAKWAAGYDRSVVIRITEKEEENACSISSVPAAYTIYTSDADAEEEGTYDWDYTSVDPNVLPRNGSYKLSYTVYSGDTIFETENAAADIKLLPEPGVLCLAVLSLLLSMRRRSL